MNLCQHAPQVSTLQHPFIVPCVESWLVQGHTVNMIYGYCEKGDLSIYLQRVQRMVSRNLVHLSSVNFDDRTVCRAACCVRVAAMETVARRSNHCLQEGARV
jgi:hypothetical protein